MSTRGRRRARARGRRRRARYTGSSVAEYGLESVGRTESGLVVERARATARYTGSSVAEYGLESVGRTESGLVVERARATARRAVARRRDARRRDARSSARARVSVGARVAVDPGGRLRVTQREIRDMASGYVGRDGTARASKPFSLAGAVWHVVDVADAFVRTLVVDGYAETYAARGRGGGAASGTPGRAAAMRTATGAGGSGAARVRGFSNVRTIDHSAPAAGG